ncbi:hypothetical protein E3P92_02854 [Wallemia ichthyophaga]|uniref:Uncharacterized protein n=1 Tax=Wallemia ichthyophaga TaxID=245174 RepID=A0A4T0H6L3_WALIC|nr:hypothetical protein E3P91_03996 [Wallemia ichthyophaga]TIA80646.1 hypothetical protein E3P98_02597 [Wallemia ichthyophaga]TIA97911.1 hypothetical protein E3P95_02684 [Wallemia ichthyophaga]TIA99096.1 hypothetical protein E3P94_02735 [Wallemia ichthyophaga]TIB10775.1 hypothetical protein E3P90_02738 [Wallemia ichthyophaga]
MTRCDNTENHQPNYVFKKHTYILNSLYLKIEIYFNNAKALAVFTFTATIAPVASKSNISRRGNDRDLWQGVDSKNDDTYGKYDKQDKLSHEDAFKKHREEVEKHIKPNNDTGEKNKPDFKVGGSDVC